MFPVVRGMELSLMNLEQLRERYETEIFEKLYGANIIPQAVVSIKD